ncbi:MATE family efflux transporter [Faecalibacterium sp. An122]|uniref:MATE family efflux transporter n=1 Tax=Faecalibacterium sp. An122 TaxID=1965551 RepID=UPI000B367900|nr:MATE family efflux transporter [Faecalibacterium sp. An122]OUQ37603.1 MATE family efflux transporter [Faecalibacterium sp. An122]
MEQESEVYTPKILKNGPGGPIFTTNDLLRLIVPLLIEQLLATTVGMADTMMVSRCGEAAISGVSLVDMINNLIINLLAALATGGAVVVSQYLGAGRKKETDDSAGQLVLLSLLLGLGLGLFSWALARPMLRLLYGNIEADVLDAGVRYLQVTALSYPFLALYNAGAAIFRSMGNSKISMQISLLMNAINIVGNAVCIFGLNMYVEGVAWPTVISRALAAALILAACGRKSNTVQARMTLRVDGGLARRILGIGIPSAFENSLFQAGRIVVVSVISLFGTVQIAANAVANNLDGMGCIPGQAISLAMITVVGRCVGAQDNEQAAAYARRLLKWTYLTMGLFNGAILLFVKPLVGIYALSGETMELAILLVRIHCGCGLLLWPVAFVLPNALRAANDVRFTMTVSVLSMAVWRLGFSYLLGVQMGYGAVGVWIAMVIDWIFRSACFVGRFRSGVWKTKYLA